MKQPIPTFETDEAAADFVDRADLANYDLSGGHLVRFELRRKDTSISLRLPEALLDAVRAHASQVGMPAQRFIRLAIESALQREGRPET